MTWNKLLQSLLSGAIPGAAGGLAWFLLCLKRGRIAKGMRFRKALVETVGGMLTASFLSFPLGPMPQHVMASVFGVCWADMIQRIRAKVTDIVEVALRT